MPTQPVLSDRIFAYLEKAGAGTNAQIASGIKEKPNTVAARTCQMIAGGALTRENENGDSGPFIYTIQDREGRTSKKPKRKRRMRAKVAEVVAPLQEDNPLAAAVQVLGNVLADLIIAQVGRSIALKASGMLLKNGDSSVVEESTH